MTFEKRDDGAVATLGTRDSFVTVINNFQDSVVCQVLLFITSSGTSLCLSLCWARSIER